jgi:long-chain fatty acid transport protein
VGALWQATPTIAVGASYSSKIDFESFEWNSAHANPNRANFGTARKITFDLDAPANFIVGLGLTPTPRLSIALDAKRVNFSDTDGFGSGIDAQGNAIGLGWEDIDVFALGVQFRPVPRLALRAGYNKAENAIPEASQFFNVASPAVFEDHACVGFGWRVVPDLELNLTLYRAFENRVSGPFVSPFGPVPGTQVTNEMTLNSAVVTFSFRL